MPKKNKPQHHLVVVGSGAVGKSALTLQFMFGEFVEVYDPTQGDSYRKKVTLDGQDEQVDILDTAGQEEFVSIRDNYYKTGEGFLLVFSIVSKESFIEAGNMFEQICRVKDTQSAPAVIVGNKSDLEDERQVARDEAQAFADKHNIQYMETSAKFDRNVKEAFYMLIGIVKQDKKKGNNNPTPTSGGEPSEEPSTGCCSVM